MSRKRRELHRRRVRSVSGRPAIAKLFGDPVSRLVVFVLEHLIADDTDIAAKHVVPALTMLEARLDGPFEVAAHLVKAGGAGVRELLRPFRAQPAVAELFGPRKQSIQQVLERARALGQGRDAREAAADVVRRYGLGALDRLNQYAKKCPEIRALLGLPPQSPRGRPPASTTIDLEAYTFGELSRLGVSDAQLRQAIGGSPRQNTGPSDNRRRTREAQTVARRLTRARKLKDPAIVAQSPDGAIITFEQHYRAGCTRKRRKRSTS